MHFATTTDLKAIYNLFSSRKDVFPHIRWDALKRRIEAGQCIYQEGVCIVYQVYRKRTRVGDVSIPRQNTMLHQIVNAEPGNGAGGMMFECFCETVVTGSLYLSVRSANEVACRFYERHGMKVVSKVAWSGGTLPGLIYGRQHNAHC